MIVVVNDGSSDDTYKIAKSFENNYNNVKLLNHLVNKGLGEAVNTGINYAISQKNSGLLCIMDADMTHQPNYIFSMINKLKKEELSCVIAKMSVLFSNFSTTRLTAFLSSTPSESILIIYFPSAM